MSKQKENGTAWCDYTFNPWIGCTKVSPACDNCYAETIAKRFFPEAKWGNHPRVLTSEANWRKPWTWANKYAKKINAWELKKHIEGLEDPDLVAMGLIKPIKPKVFCGSMCDIFDNKAPEEELENLSRLIYETEEFLDWLILTKRIGNVEKLIKENELISKAIKHSWLGITVCNQEEANRDIPKLLKTPASKRFISIEPMLGVIDLTRLDVVDFAYDLDALNPENNEDSFYENVSIDWVIVGGETGHKARYMNADWARSIRGQCKQACVPFFFKQWGEFDEIGQKVGKKKAGYLLDGIECKEYPNRGRF